MRYNWNWGIFFQPAADGSGTWLNYLLVGVVWTLGTALAAWVIALAIGSVVGVMRTTPSKWAVRFGNAYVEFFRNVPLLVQMFLWFFVLPELLPQAIGGWIKQMPPPWSAYIPAVLCLGFYTAARVAEQVRAGIQSLPRGQQMAGTAMGLTVAQTYRYVLLPQAYRIVLPPLTSEFLNIIKQLVALTIGLSRSPPRAVYAEFTFQVFEAFTAATSVPLITSRRLGMRCQRVVPPTPALAAYMFALHWTLYAAAPISRVWLRLRCSSGSSCCPSSCRRRSAAGSSRCRRRGAPTSRPSCASASTPPRASPSR